MNNRMFPVAAAAVLAITVLADPAGAKGKSTTADEPQIIAVKFHADWCGSCKAMGPVFTDLANKYDGKPILFVTFDLTNRTTSLQAEYLSAALDLGKVWAKYAPKTGYILVVDAKTKSVLDNLTKKDGIKAMGTKLLAALEQTG